MNLTKLNLFEIILFGQHRRRRRDSVYCWPCGVTDKIPGEWHCYVTVSSGCLLWDVWHLSIFLSHFLSTTPQPRHRWTLWHLYVWSLSLIILTNKGQISIVLMQSNFHSILSVPAKWQISLISKLVWKLSDVWFDHMRKRLYGDSSQSI